MGRILRRGTRSNASSSGSQSFFYSLISTDTMEMYFANKRRRYLVDQGYAYKVVPAWPGLAPTQEALCDGARLMRTQDDRNAVLTQVLLSNIDDIEAREDRALRSFIVEDDDTDGVGVGGKKKGGRAVTFNAADDEKTSGSLSSSSSSALPEGVTLRSLSSMSALSGADGIRYLEFTSDKSSKDLMQQEKMERRAEEGKGAKGVIVAKRRPVETPLI